MSTARPTDRDGAMELQACSMVHFPSGCVNRRAGTCSELQIPVPQLESRYESDKCLADTQVCSQQYIPGGRAQNQCSPCLEKNNNSIGRFKWRTD